MTNRRSFLTMLGIGSVAGPSAVTEALAGSGGASIGMLGSAVKMYSGDDKSPEAETEDSSEFMPEIWDLRNSIRNFADLEPDDPRDYTVTFLDADLEVNKSMSLVTKRRIMIERQIKRNYENSKRNYKTHIRRVLQKQRKKFMPDVIYKALFDENNKEYDTPEMRRLLNLEEKK